MDVFQSLLEALTSINANKMRSGLTVLGIVIGVAAVIAMLSIGQGAESTITDSISGIGSNLLFIFPGNSREMLTNAETLTMSDVRALSDKDRAPSLELVVPGLQGNATFSYAGKNQSGILYGSMPEQSHVMNLTMAEGEFLSSENVLGRSAVAVIGSDVALKLFDRMDGIAGETIKINGQPFKVIGVVRPRGGGSFGSQDNFVNIPLTTAQVRFIKRDAGAVDTIYIKAASAEVIQNAKDEITEVLRSQHKIFLKPDDFTIFSQDDMLQTMSTITGTFTIFLGGIASISLLVGGIGIMNIMLVSVTERTKEIGLRKAVGAKKIDILIQFLTESAMLSLMGGLIGVALGWLIAFAVGRVATMLGTQLNPVVGIDSILLATIFSTAVGLFFGIYPANRAANMEPVEALRTE